MSNRHCGNCCREGDAFCLSHLIKYYNTSVEVGEECKHFLEKIEKIKNSLPISRKSMPMLSKPLTAVSTPSKPKRVMIPARELARRKPKKSVFKMDMTEFFNEIRRWRGQ